MQQFRKIVGGLLTLSLTFAVASLGSVGTVYGLQLKEAKVSLSDSRPSVSASHTISFKIATTGNVGSMQLVYTTTPSGSGVPTGLTADANTSINSITIPGADTVNWTRTNPANGTIRLARGSTVAATADDLFTITLDAFTNNNQTAACDAVANSDSCFVRITTFSDTGFSTAVDTSVASYTIVDAVTVSATVDPILTFTVIGVNSGNVSTNDSNVSTGTAVTSTVTTLPFGNVTVGTPKIAQQELRTQTNANNGYFVYGKFITAGNQVMIGNAVPGNNIDRFTGALTDGTWTAPKAWATPVGTVANVNTAWLGVRTTDTDVAGYNTSDVWGPPDVLSDSGSGKAVMSSTGPDNGAALNAVFVSYKIQANAFQPADQYAGTWTYNVLASY